MKLEAAKDYSFLLGAPGQVAELFRSYGVTMEHPVLKLPTPFWVVHALGLPDGRARLEKGLEDREKLIKLMERDPLTYGYKPQTWTDLRELLWGAAEATEAGAGPAGPEAGSRKKFRIGSPVGSGAAGRWGGHKTVMVTGPNRGAKTEGAADLVMEVLTTIPKARVWCGCETNETSIRGGGQQEVVWKYLPPSWKALNHKRTDQYSISYNPKTRFADNSFIAPNGSECRFMNYEQDIGVIEGGAIDLFWFDEDAPVEWVVTAEGRLVDRNGRGIVTYTPVRGWNGTYGLYNQGGAVLEWQEFPLFPEIQHYPGGKAGMIPYVIQSPDPGRAQIFFRPNANPFVSWEALVKQWASSSYEVQMARLAGLVRKKIGNRFPKFNVKVHVIPWALIPTEGTNYHFLDFAWERNWYQFWVRVRRIGDLRQLFIYREWPDKRTYGEWAVPSKKPNGDRGPAQTSVGLSITGYKDLAVGLEKAGKEKVFQRFGDPRSGRAAAITLETGGTCIIDQLQEAGITVDPAKGLQIGEGVNMLNQLFDYNEELFQAEGKLTATNQPQLFIWEGCEQLIDCLGLWTGQGTEKEQASKDPIDLGRYMATEDLEDLPEGVLGSSGGGSY